jgi:DNA-nicking Smr family endonuclease
MAKKPDHPGRRRRIGTLTEGLSEEDRRLFRSAMGDAKRLPGRDDDDARSAAPGAVAARGARPPVAGSAAEPSRRLPHLDAGVAAGLDTRTMDRLRRGRIRPEARLDLHGMTRQEAHGALTAFMARTESAGRRCVIVITGKGRVSEGGGVLRNEVPGWLNAPAIRHRILGFAEAQPKDGGAGALYVLLRRARGPGRGKAGAT